MKTTEWRNDRSPCNNQIFFAFKDKITVLLSLCAASLQNKFALLSQITP